MGISRFDALSFSVGSPTRNSLSCHIPRQLNHVLSSSIVPAGARVSPGIA